MASPLTDGPGKFGQWRQDNFFYFRWKKDSLMKIDENWHVSKLKTLRHTWKPNSAVALKMEKYGYHRCDIEALVLSCLPLSLNTVIFSISSVLTARYEIL